MFGSTVAPQQLLLDGRDFSMDSVQAFIFILFFMFFISFGLWFNLESKLFRVILLAFIFEFVF